MWSVKQH